MADFASDQRNRSAFAPGSLCNWGKQQCGPTIAFPRQRAKMRKRAYTAIGYVTARGKTRWPVVPRDAIVGGDYSTVAINRRNCDSSNFQLSPKTEVKFSSRWADVRSVNRGPEAVLARYFVY